MARRGPKPRPVETIEVDRFKIIERRLIEIDSQNKTIIQMLNAQTQEFNKLKLQLVQTIKGLIELREPTPSSPSEQLQIEQLQKQGFQVRKGT